MQEKKSAHYPIVYQVVLLYEFSSMRLSTSIVTLIAKRIIHASSHLTGFLFILISSLLFKIRNLFGKLKNAGKWPLQRIR